MLAAHWYEISPMLSLGIVVVMLGITVVVSLLAKEESSAGTPA
jgi:uncharacterized membrane protein (DUF373 family)